LSQTLQKSSADAPSALDVVTDDSGNVDLVDLQYTLFNFIAAVFVLTQFVPHPARGIPAIPAALAVLAGVSATVYTSNKLVVTNPPAIIQVTPAAAAPGAEVTVTGRNLVVNPNPADPAGDGQATTIILSPSATDSLTAPGIEAAWPTPSPAPFTATRATADTVTFSVPGDVPPGRTTWDVRLTTNAGGHAISYQALKVVRPPASRGSSGPAAPVLESRIGVPLPAAPPTGPDGGT
jgi:hypothetical protein